MNKKTCSVCKTELPLNCFSIDSRSTDGKRSACKTCTSKRNKERAPHWNSRSKENRRALWKRLIERHGDITKKSRDTKYRQNNKTKIAIRAKTYFIDMTPHKCSVTGCNQSAERHHTDYSSPDHFIWLCKEHHIEEHQKRQS